MKVITFQTYQPVRIHGKVETFFSIKQAAQVANGLKMEFVENLGIKLQLYNQKCLISLANIAYIIYEDEEVKVEKKESKKDK